MSKKGVAIGLRSLWTWNSRFIIFFLSNRKVRLMSNLMGRLNWHSLCAILQWFCLARHSRTICLHSKYSVMRKKYIQKLFNIKSFHEFEKIHLKIIQHKKFSWMRKNTSKKSQHKKFSWMDVFMHKNLEQNTTNIFEQSFVTCFMPMHRFEN